MLLWDRLLMVVEQRAEVNICIIRDLNSILEVGERVGLGGTGSLRDRREFKEFVERGKLVDVKIEGRKYTYYMSNGTCKSKVDRALINGKWEERWHATSLPGLPRCMPSIFVMMYLG